MRAVVQRVQYGSVKVDGETVGEIAEGLVVLVAAGEKDGEREAGDLAKKIVQLRIFADEEGKMNKSLLETGGAMLAISQFTLYGDCRRGRRPSYSTAAKTELAKPLYEKFVDAVRALGVHCETGIFQADMKVELLNDGPVTLLLDTDKAF